MSLQAAQAILARAAGRPLSIWQRSQLRAAVRAHEAQAGCSLADEHRVLLTHAEQLLDSPDRCTAMLDLADVLFAIDSAMNG